MKISTYHKQKGNEVRLNMPLWPANIRYGSWLFENGARYAIDYTGGVGIDFNILLPSEIEKCKPDYSLFNLDHSLGYTFKDCYRNCPFCKVPLFPKERTHHSIWEFHNKKFNVIELLNNNIFFDPDWEKTFEEIYEADLRVIDHGMDLRLLDDKKVWWIKKLKWKNQPKFAWDRMENEGEIIDGLELLKKHSVRAVIYVLMGFDTTMEENIYRCQKIYDYGSKPFPMLYKPTKLLRQFRRMIYLRYYGKYNSIKEAWENYKRRFK